MNKEKELEKLKHLRSLIDSTYKDNMKVILINEYMNYKQFLVDANILEEDYFDDEDYELNNFQNNITIKLSNSAYKNFFNNIDLITEITTKLCELHKKFPINLKYNSLNNIKKISKEEADDLINSFFKSLGDDIESIFLSMKQKDNIITIKDEYTDYDGTCYDLSFFDFPKILLINKNNPLELFHTLAHEMGHCYEFIRNRTNKNSTNYNFLVEVPSITFDKLYDEYLVKIGYYKDIGIYNLLTWKRVILKMNEINDFVNVSYKNGFVSKDYEEFGGLDLDETAYFDASDEIINNISYFGTNLYNYGYVLSDIIANSLISKYISNRKEGLKEIKNFITTLHQYPIKDNLEKYAKDLKDTEYEMKELYNYQKKKFYL